MATTGDAAVHLFMSDQRFRQLQKEGVIPRFPVADVDLDVCREAYVLHLRAGASGRQAVTGRPGQPKGGKEFVLEHERGRLAKEQADCAAMKNSAMRGELVETSRVEQAVGDAFSRCRGRLRSIPSKAAPRLVDKSSPAEIQAFLAAQVDEALAELSEGAVIAAAADKSRADVGGAAEEGAPPPAAPAEADRKPVGRRPSSAERRG